MKKLFTPEELAELQQFDKVVDHGAGHDETARRMDASAIAMDQPGYKWKIQLEDQVGTHSEITCSFEARCSLGTAWEAVQDFRATVYGVAYGDNRGYRGLI